VVHARTDLSLATAEFVRPGGRPGHEGQNRIEGQPIAERPATLRLRLSAAQIQTLGFVLVSIGGQVLQQLDLPEAGEAEFVGQIALPREPFRVAVTGTDVSGLPFQRLHAPLFHAERVELTVRGSDDTLPAGSTSPVSVLVRNHGAAAGYRMVAVDGRGEPSRVEPPIIQLGQGAEAPVQVWITVPASAPPGSTLDMTVTAESDGPEPAANSVTHRFTIVPARQDRIARLR
jgi:hypothetical protein